MNTKSILLVEDNPSDAALAKRAFDRNKLLNPIIHVEDGQEALDFLFAGGQYAHRDMEDLPALILLDLKLPLVDGLEVLRRVRENPITRRTLVVILTTSKEEQDVAASYDLGVNSYIRKPVDFNQFVEAIKQLGVYWLLLNETPPSVK
jgi:two-component system response regulator